jgi:hypothetical protein
VQCLLELSTPADAESAADIILLEGHDASDTAASSLIAELSASDGVEAVAGGAADGVSSRAAGAQGLEEFADAKSGEGEGMRPQQLRTNPVLLRQLCCCVYAASSSVERVVEEWRSAACREVEGLRSEASQQARLPRSVPRLREKGKPARVSVLPNEAVRDIFMQRPKDQYEDVPNGDGTYWTRMLFDRLGRKMPFVTRRPRRQRSRPLFGPDSQMGILAKKYKVRSAIIKNVWMRKTYTGVTNSIKGHLVAKIEEDFWAEQAAAELAAAVGNAAASHASPKCDAGVTGGGVDGEESQVGGETRAESASASGMHEDTDVGVEAARVSSGGGGDGAGNSDVEMQLGGRDAAGHAAQGPNDCGGSAARPGLFPEPRAGASSEIAHESVEQGV